MWFSRQTSPDPAFWECTCLIPKKTLPDTIGHDSVLSCSRDMDEIHYSEFENPNFDAKAPGLSTWVTGVFVSLSQIGEKPKSLWKNGNSFYIWGDILLGGTITNSNYVNKDIYIYILCISVTFIMYKHKSYQFPSLPKELVQRYRKRVPLPQLQKLLRTHHGNTRQELVELNLGISTIGFWATQRGI